MNAAISTCLFSAFLMTGVKVYEKDENDEKKKEVPVKGHVFGWPFLKAVEMQPRGGTSTGGDIKLFTGEKDVWKKLLEKDVSPKQMDRRAILAMQGAYINLRVN